MNGTIYGTLALGFVLGLKHALDADHLVAVSTIVGREKSVWKSSLVGAVWGMGHTASLFVAAVAVILLRLTISPRAAATMEFAVGLMLIGLGIDLVRRVVRGEIAVHSHTHDGGGASRLHVHAFGVREPGEGHSGVGKRPFFIGLIHGLAGSAALMLFVLTTITSPWLGVVYVLIFGGGTIGGMLVMSTILGLPFALANRVFEGVVGKIQFAAGLGSLGFGVFYAWHVAAAGGIFSAVAH
jgi:ABC-type nickel/cobalt efflux system permease component RcnA